MPARTKLAQLVAKEEGFGRPGVKPTRDHNPGDLEHAPHIEAWDGAIGIEPTDADGWDDLERQLELYAARGMTLRQMAYVYAPPKQNDSARYLGDLCAGMPCAPDDLIRDLLRIPAEEL